jgi:hypothetical protein
MSSKTIKKKTVKKPSCKCEDNILSILGKLEMIKERQDILMDGHVILSDRFNNLSLWRLIKNCFKRKKKEQ